MSRQSRLYWLFCEGEWYVRKSNHLLFLKFISAKNHSISFGKLCFVKSLLGMSLYTYISIPPPFRFRSTRKGEGKPSIRKIDVVNVLSSFVSVNANISTWLGIRHLSNFPDMELMFRFPIMTVFGFFSLTFLSSHFDQYYLVCLNLCLITLRFCLNYCLIRFYKISKMV